MPQPALSAAPSTELTGQALDERYRRYRRLILATLILFYGFSYTCRLGLSLVKKPLIDGGIYSAVELGQIGAAFLYGYGFGKFFNGFWSDRLRLRWFLPAGLFLSALANLAMGSTTLFWVALGLWGVNGLFQGVGAPASIVVMSRWFSDRERGRYYGIWNASHAIGEGLNFVGTAALVAMAGWNAAFLGPGALCVLVSIATYTALRDRPEEVGLPPVESWRKDGSLPCPEEHLSTGQAQWAVIRMPALWVLGLASACMYVARYAINNWGVLYLQEAHGYTLTQAGALIGLNTFAGIAGSVAYGFLSDLLFKARRPPLTLIFGILELGSLILFFAAPRGSTWLLTGSMLLYGFTLSGLLAVVGGLFAVDLAPRKATGAAMGFIGVFSYLGAGLQELVSGKLIHQGTTLVDGVKHYNFDAPILFWVGATALSVLLAASLWNVQRAR